MPVHPAYPREPAGIDTEADGRVPHPRGGPGLDPDPASEIRSEAMTHPLTTGTEETPSLSQTFSHPGQDDRGAMEGLTMNGMGSPMARLADKIHTSDIPALRGVP